MSDEELTANRLVGDTSGDSFELEPRAYDLPFTRHAILEKQAEMNEVINEQQRQLEEANAEIGRLRSLMLEALMDGAAICSDIYRTCLNLKQAKRLPAETAENLDEHVKFCTDMKAELEHENEGMRETVENTRPFSDSLMREAKQLSDLNRRLHGQLEEGTEESDMVMITKLNDRIDEQLGVLKGMQAEFEVEMEMRNKTKQELVEKLRRLGAPGFQEEEAEYYSETAENENVPLGEGEGRRMSHFRTRAQSVAVFNLPNANIPDVHTAALRRPSKPPTEQELLLSDEEMSDTKGGTSDNYLLEPSECSEV